MHELAGDTDYVCVLTVISATPLNIQKPCNVGLKAQVEGSSAVTHGIHSTPLNPTGTQNMNTGQRYGACIQSDVL